MSYDGKILGIPRDISNLVLYINLDKMDLPNQDWSINDLIQNAEAQIKQNIFGIGCEENIYWATPYLSYFGGGILDNNYDLIINSEKSQKALDECKNRLEN